MDQQNIHPTAIIETGAKIGKGVTIEAYAIVKENVTLEDNVTIKAHAYLDGHTTVGEGTTIWPFASIGAQTQALAYKGERTFVKIGKRCTIREYVTINSSYDEDAVVELGDDCLIMAYCHIAHHCKVGNHVVMANSAMLAGHVTVDDFAIIGGMTPVHQNVRIGRHAMVGGFSRLSHDVAPYTIGGGDPYRIAGLNLVGLKRRGFDLAERSLLGQAFKITFRSGLPIQEALEKIEAEVPSSEHVDHWLEFCRSSSRGLLGVESAEDATVTL